MDDFVLPIYYVVSRQITPAHIPHLLNALRITPVSVTIASEATDMELARQLSEHVIRVTSPEEALALALEIGKTSWPLVIGESDLLDAVFADGRKEALPTHACS